MGKVGPPDTVDVFQNEWRGFRFSSLLGRPVSLSGSVQGVLPSLLLTPGIKGVDLFQLGGEVMKLESLGVYSTKGRNGVSPGRQVPGRVFGI